MKRKLKTCDRCGRRVRSLAAMSHWNVTVKGGIVTSLICDRCQTVEEFVEAEVNFATLDYAIIGGRLAARPKSGTPGR